MKINGKSITGLFIYNEEATYERGDMVIKGTTIYVCSPIGSDSVIGEDPETSNNYYTYLCDRFETTEGYLNSVENNLPLENKACSLDTLQTILNYFMIGIDSKGIIGDHIIIDSFGNYKIKLGNLNEESFTDYNNILSEIMLRDEINNGIFKVSNTLPELQLYGISNCCIIKQYTTYNEMKTRVRIQELIDPESGLIYLRSIKGTEIPGSFKCAIIKSRNLKNQIDKIILTYTNRLNYLETLETSLKNNFRYKHLSFSTNTNSSITVSLKSSNKDSNIISILLLKRLDDSYESYTVTVNLNFKGPEGSYPVYSIFNDTGRLNIKKEDSDDNSYTFDTNDSNILFSDIVYRDYYGD